MNETRPLLFRPITLRGLSVRNRAWVPPMCQYAVEPRDGVPQDWHVVHYGSLAVGGFGLVMAEFTAVVDEGRITPYDTGLWNDRQQQAWSHIVDIAHANGAAIGVQLAHAGYKASTERPWPGRQLGVLGPDEGGWAPVGASTTTLTDRRGRPVPVHGLDEQEIAGVVNAFVASTRRAEKAGFDTVEIHAAHGYLLHQFYSPLTNDRTDGWGGDRERRARLTLEVARAVRGAFPAYKPVLLRISSSDWNPAGWGIEDSVWLCRQLREIGIDLVDASSGGLPGARITLGPGYQVPFADQIRREAGIPTAAVGLITGPRQAEEILEQGRADVVDLGRESLRDTNWPLRAAHELGLPAEQAPWAPARWRGHWPA